MKLCKNHVSPLYFRPRPATMDSLTGATLLKADGSKVAAEAALDGKVGRLWYTALAEF